MNAGDGVQVIHLPVKQVSQLSLGVQQPSVSSVQSSAAVFKQQLSISQLSSTFSRLGAVNNVLGPKQALVLRRGFLVQEIESKNEYYSIFFTNNNWTLHMIRKYPSVDSLLV